MDLRTSHFVWWTLVIESINHSLELPWNSHGSVEDWAPTWKETNIGEDYPIITNCYTPWNYVEVWFCDFGGDSTWKWMVGIRSFPFGFRPTYRCELLVLGRINERKLLILEIHPFSTEPWLSEVRATELIYPWKKASGTQKGNGSSSKQGKRLVSGRVSVFQSRGFGILVVNSTHALRLKVAGWSFFTNPSEKYANVKMEIHLPQVLRGEHSKNLWVATTQKGSMAL